MACGVITGACGENEPVNSKTATAKSFPSCCDVVIFSQDRYCGGYSGEDPPLPIPNREVKLTIADGTAPPGGRVGSCHALYDTLSSDDDGVSACIWDTLEQLENVGLDGLGCV